MPCPLQEPHYTSWPLYEALHLLFACLAAAYGLAFGSPPRRCASTLWQPFLIHVGLACSGLDCFVFLRASLQVGALLVSVIFGVFSPALQVLNLRSDKYLLCDAAQNSTCNIAGLALLLFFQLFQALLPGLACDFAARTWAPAVCADRPSPFLVNASAASALRDCVYCCVPAQSEGEPPLAGRQ